MADFKEFANSLYENNIEIIQMSFDHVMTLLELEDVHRDPFDRIIISTAKFENIPVITKDNHFNKYHDLKVVW